MAEQQQIQQLQQQLHQQQQNLNQQQQNYQQMQQQQQQLVQQLAAAGNQLAAVTARLDEAVQRAETAEQDRRKMLDFMVSQKSAPDGGIVDVKGVGQPFKFTGGKDQDYPEWCLKFVTFIKARYRNSSREIEEALKWAVKQKKSIVKDAVMGDTRTVSWSDRFGPGGVDEIDDCEKVLDDVYTYLISFTTGNANKIVRNSGVALEAWRRMACEYDPISSMRRVAILNIVQNPPRCEKVEDLGEALESWLTKKKQYESYVDKDGHNCVVSEDSLLNAMYRIMPKALEEQMLFRDDEYSTFEAIFDKLVAYSSNKHSLVIKDQTNDKKGGVVPMDIGALGKGKGGSFKGKCHKCGQEGHKAEHCPGKGKGNGGKSGKGNRMENVQCWKCGGYGHYGKDCWNKGGGAKGGGKPKGGGKTKGGKGKKGKGKGKGKKGFNSLDGQAGDGQQWSDDSWKQDGDWSGAAHGWDQGWQEGGQASGSPEPQAEPGGKSLGGLDLSMMEEGGSSSSSTWYRDEPEKTGNENKISCVGCAEVVGFVCPGIMEPCGKAVCPGCVVDSCERGKKVCTDCLINFETYAYSSYEGPGLNAVSPAERPKYLEWHRNSKGEWEEWIKVNYDSGAATTAFPVGIVDDVSLEKVGTFTVASGSEIPNYGRVRLSCRDEEGNPRKVSGSVTTVHKPLGSAGEFSASHDGWLWSDGGALIPRNHPVAVGLAKEYNRLVGIHGDEGILPLHKEGNLYNFYLKKEGKTEMVPDVGRQEAHP